MPFFIGTALGQCREIAFCRFRLREAIRSLD
jgi:hypothetical protein